MLCMCKSVHKSINMDEYKNVDMHYLERELDVVIFFLVGKP